MKKLAMVLVIAYLGLGLVGCYCTPIMPPMGILYSEFRAPLDPNLEETELGNKSGTAETRSILGLVTTGDCSIKAAAANGGLNTITYADYEYFNVLGVYQRFMVIVYGQ